METAMKNRALIITVAITVLAAILPVPRANADPLTVLAILGLATVASISTVDIVASHDEDTRDFRAQHGVFTNPERRGAIGPSIMSSTRSVTYCLDYQAGRLLVSSTSPSIAFRIFFFRLLKASIDRGVCAAT